MSNKISLDKKIGTEIEGDCFNVHINLIGIKKRCRKVEKHYIVLGYVKLDFNEDELKKLVKNTVLTVMKEFNPKIHVQLTYTRRGGGMEEFQLFDPRSKSIYLVDEFWNE